jgi:hypothetical protein
MLDKAYKERLEDLQVRSRIESFSISGAFLLAAFSDVPDIPFDCVVVIVKPFVLLQPMQLRMRDGNAEVARLTVKYRRRMDVSGRGVKSAEGGIRFRLLLVHSCLTFAAC